MLSMNVIKVVTVCNLALYAYTGQAISLLATLAGVVAIFLKAIVEDSDEL